MLLLNELGKLAIGMLMEKPKMMPTRAQTLVIVRLGDFTPVYVNQLYPLAAYTKSLQAQMISFCESIVLEELGHEIGLSPTEYSSSLEKSRKDFYALPERDGRTV